jgi:hypothetical protein
VEPKEVKMVEKTSNEIVLESMREAFRNIDTDELLTEEERELLKELLHNAENNIAYAKNGEKIHCIWE